jgi:hypothetical protein
MNLVPVKNAACANAGKLGQRLQPRRPRFLFGKLDPSRVAANLIDRDFAMFEDYSDVLERAKQGEVL